jgi:hypothetical protein
MATGPALDGASSWRQPRKGRSAVRHSLVQRGLIALVLVLAMGVWFSASAVVPALATQW